MLARFFNLLMLVIFILVLNVIIWAIEAILGPFIAAGLLMGLLVAFMAYYVVYGEE